MMNKNQRLFTAGGVLSLALTVAFVGTGSADAQGQRPSTPVSIVDPIPMPITGTVATIDNGVRRPVHYRFHLSASGGISSSTFTVPAGHRLVIDHVSMFADTLGTTSPAGGPWVQIEVAAVSPSPNYRPFDFVARSPNHQLTLHESLRLVFDANESVRVALQALSTGLTARPGGFSVDVSLTGYLVDCSEVSCEPMVYSLSS